jgi:hypothetical protein
MRTLLLLTCGLLAAPLGCGGNKVSTGDTSSGSGEASGKEGDERDDGKLDDGASGLDEGEWDDGKAEGDLEDRECLGCWYENKMGECGALLTACEEDLACSLLMDCPYDCAGAPDCVEQCNAIVPTGVAPLTELVACIGCGDGPCAEACADSHFAEYCE